MPGTDNLLQLLLLGPRLAATGLRVAGAVLRGAADVLDRAGERGVGDERDDGDEDRLWQEPGAGARNGAPPSDSAFARAPGGTAAVEDPSGAGEEQTAAGEPPAEAARAAEAAPSDGPGAVQPPEPEHVSEEPVLVADVADPGAEDGAGPEIHVDEPWRGYSEMTAADIVDRLSAEPDAVVAIVELYEGVHRGRRSVLQAAQRELKQRGPR